MAIAVAAPNSPPPQRTNNDTKPAPIENEAMNVLSAYVCSYLQRQQETGEREGDDTGGKDVKARGCDVM
jgi:hypothetical protein